MLNLVYTYAGTLLAIATAVGGALWAFFKWGGQTAVEQWLKKNYKAWELEAEKPYKEDFKRFEGKLDALASQDQTKFEYIYNERVAAIKELHRTCLVLEHNVTGFILGRDYMTNETAGYKPLKEKGEALQKAMHDAIRAIRQQIREGRMYLDDSIQAGSEELVEYCESLKPTNNVQSWQELRIEFDTLDAKVKVVERAFKAALGADKV